LSFAGLLNERPSLPAIIATKRNPNTHCFAKNKAFRPHRSLFHCKVLEHPPGSSLSLAALSQAWVLEPGPFSVKKGRFFEEALFSFSSKNVITVFL